MDWIKDQLRRHEEHGSIMNKLLKKKPSEEEGATKEIGVAANDLFNRVQEYAELEFEGSISELRCLEEMNLVSAAKFDEISNTVDGICGFQKGLSTKHAELKHILDEIDLLHETVIELEGTTDRLDAYSKRLESSVTSQ